MKFQTLITFVLTLIASSYNWAASINNSDFDTIITTKNCSIKIHSQTIVNGKNTSESKYIIINYSPTIETINEAESKNIKVDKLFFELIYDENCVLKSITVRKKGQLVNFNKEAELLCIELYNEIKKTEISKYFENNINGKCENVILPLKLTIQ